MKREGEPAPKNQKESSPREATRNPRVAVTESEESSKEEKMETGRRED